MPYKANEPRRHKIPKARYKIENWAEYDAALRRLSAKLRFAPFAVPVEPLSGSSAAQAPRKT